MIRDYFRFPRRRDAHPYQDMREHYREPGRQAPRHAREKIDWESWINAEAMRGSPRSPGQGRAFEQRPERNHFEAGYGYGDAYFEDDQRLNRPRFQQGWEGAYRGAPWTLGADQISPGLHGPYGRPQQHDDLYQEAWPFEDDSPDAMHSHTQFRTHPYRHGRESPGMHRGVGPQSYTRTDERIREDVCDQLTDHPEVDARHIDVKVENGVVLLQGTVSDRNMKYDAEDCSWYVNGVKDVDNRIRVDFSQPAPRQEGTNPSR